MRSSRREIDWKEEIASIFVTKNSTQKGYKIAKIQIAHQML